MKAFEFEAHVSADGNVVVPADVRKQLSPTQPLRVLLLVTEPNEDTDWSRLTAEQFLQGYDASDAIYDDLPAR